MLLAGQELAKRLKERDEYWKQRRLEVGLVEVPQDATLEERIEHMHNLTPEQMEVILQEVREKTGGGLDPDLTLEEMGIELHYEQPKPAQPPEKPPEQ